MEHAALTPLPLQPADLRPRSLLDHARPSPGQLAAGALVALIVHAGVPALALAVLGALALAGVTLEAAAPAEPPPIEHVIQARFLQLGEQIDPRQLPNRRVPILRTDTAEPAPSKRASSEPVVREPRERQPRAVQDLMQRLSQDAQHFAEREERRVQEGSPDGVEGGERQASEGDLYAGRLSSFFRRGWQVPTTLSREQLRPLTARVSVRIGSELRVEGFRLVRSSGNPDYDLSVEQQLQRLVDTQAVIPPPPDEVASNYVGREVGFNYLGRDAR
jgi:hypothetical protein